MVIVVIVVMRGGKRKRKRKCIYCTFADMLTFAATVHLCLHLRLRLRLLCIHTSHPH